MEINETAIDWLINKYFGGLENCTLNFRNFIEIAKQKEKQQMSETFFFSQDEMHKTFSSDVHKRKGFEEYFNEKFNTTDLND